MASRKAELAAETEIQRRKEAQVGILHAYAFKHGHIESHAMHLVLWMNEIVADLAEVLLKCPAAVLVSRTAM